MPQTRRRVKIDFSKLTISWKYSILSVRVRNIRVYKRVSGDLNVKYIRVDKYSERTAKLYLDSVDFEMDNWNDHSEKCKYYTWFFIQSVVCVLKGKRSIPIAFGLKCLDWPNAASSTYICVLVLVIIAGSTPCRAQIWLMMLTLQTQTGPRQQHEVKHRSLSVSDPPSNIN